MAESVASVLLRITGDASSARDELASIAKQVQQLDATDAEASADIDSEQADRKLKDLFSDLARLAKEKVTAQVDADATEARAELSRLAAQSVEVDVEVEADTKEADRSVRGLVARLAAIRDQTVEVDVDTDQGERALARLGDFANRGRGGFRNLAQGIRDTGTVLIGVLIPGIISLMGTLAPLASTLAGAALAAGGLGLALGGALAPVMLLVTAAMERFKRTSALVGTAANDLKRQFQDFAGVLRRAVAPAAGAVLEGLTGALKTIAPLVAQLAPSFERLGGAVRRSIGVLANQLVAAGPMLERLVSGASQAVGPLARIFGNLGRVVLNLAVAAMPFLIDALRELARETRGWVKATADTGQIRGIFRDFVRDLRDVGEFAREAGRLVLAVFNAFRGPGRDAANDLTALVRETANWAESAKGQSQIRQFFSSVFFAIKDLGDFIRTYGPAIGAFFVTFGKAATFLMQALNRVSPVVAQAIGGLLGFVAFAKVLGAAVGGVVLPVLRGLAGVFQFVAQKVVFAEGIFGRFIPLLARFAGPIGAAVSTFLLLEKVMGPVRAALTILSPVISGLIFIIQGWIAVVKGAIPIISGLASAVAGGLSKAVSTVAKVVGNIVGAIVSTVAGGVKGALGAAKAVAGGIRDGIAAVADRIRETARNIIERVVAIVRGFVGGALNAGKAVFNAVRNGIASAAESIRAAASSILSRAVEIVRSFVDNALNAGRAVFNAVRNGIASAAGAVADAARSIIGRVVDIVRSFVDNLLGAGEALFNAVRRGISAAAGAIADAARGVVDRALGVVKGLAGAFLSAGGALIDALVSGIKNAAGKVIDAAKDVAGKVRDILPFSEPKDFNSPFRGLGKAGRAIVGNITDGLLDAAPLLTRRLSQVTAGLTAQVAAPAMATPTVNVQDGLARSLLAAHPGLVQNFHGPWASGLGPQSDATEAVAHLATLMRARGVPW